MTSRLWPLVSAPPTRTTSAAQRTVCNYFTVASDGWKITHVGWYRGPATVAVPVHIYLWRKQDTALLATVTPVVDSGGVGWQYTPLVTPITVYHNVLYVAGIDFNSPSDWYGAGAAPAAEYPLVYSSSGNNAAMATIPSPNGSAWDAVSVIAEPIDPATEFVPGNAYYDGTIPAIANGMASWLISTGDNTHQADGLPWQTKTLLDTVETTVSTINASVTNQGVQLTAAIADIAGVKAKLGNDGLTVEAAIGPLRAYGGITDQGIGAGLEIVRTDIIGLPASIASGQAISADLLRERLTLSPDMADPLRWTLVSTSTGSGDVALTENADLYRLILTAVPPGQARIDVGGHTWVPRWGWVAPIVHGSPMERQFPEWLTSFIRAPAGTLMSGLVIYAHPGVEWEVEAWVLDR